MDRYIIREPRANAEHPQGNQMIAILANAGRSNVMPSENIYFNGSYSDFSNMQRVCPPYMGIPQMNSSFVQPVNLLPGQGQASGIDPRYLSSFADNSAQFIVAGPQIKHERFPVQNTEFGANYQNRSVVAPDRNKPKTFTAQRLEPKREEAPKPKELNVSMNKNFKAVTKHEFKSDINDNKITAEKFQVETHKDEGKNRTMSRFDKLQAIYKSGLRAFSGPVDKVLKWHKSLHQIGVLVLYEIVDSLSILAPNPKTTISAKCVSVRAGDSCAKNLVVRDENGPAMQVVYYEIDFLLPELKPPCTVRVIGKMMPGTCRLQAYNVRLATGDDVAMLPRRAAVAAHHVAKLCKEYGASV